jgi:membrane protein
MEPHLERLFSIAKAILHELRTEKISFLAGSIAYHAFVSLLPLLLLMLVVISAVGNQNLRASFISLVGAVLTANAGDILIQELRNASTGVSLLGLVLLLWGTLRIFRGLDTAFSDIYESESQNTIADQFIDGVLVFATFGLAIGVTWGINTLLLGFGSSPFLWVLRRIVLIAGLSVTLFPIYYVFPDIDLTVREVIPGILVAAVGLMAFESLFRFYTQFRSPDGGSAIAGILLLVTWLYFGGLVLLLGAVVNAVLANRSHDVDIEPVIGGAKPNHHQHASAEREQLIASLRQAETNIKDADELVIITDSAEIHLPAPQRVTTDSEGSMLSVGDESISLELSWMP